jgi:RNA methyltransferase, TrmH family
MTIQQLTSRDNPLFKTIRLVSSGSRRAPKELVLAEGVRVLEEVEKSGRKIEALVFSEEFGLTPREKALLDRWRFPPRNLRLYQTSGNLFQSISTVQTPQGAVALVHVPEPVLDSIYLPTNTLVLYACGIQDPGNLGTLIRTAAATGTDLVCTSKGTVSARNPKVIRSSAGSFFRIPPVEHTDICEFRRYCERYSIRLYRTDARTGVIYTEADLKSSCAILLGNEAGGIAEEELLEFPAIRIPMMEGIDSLNVAIAGAVILFEAYKQRFGLRNFSLKR